MMRFVIVAGLAAVQIAGSGDVQVVEISGSPTCASCRVEFVRIATVGSPRDPVLLGEMSRLVRGASGTFVAISESGAPFIIFDSGGRYLRSVGERGDDSTQFSGRARILGRGPGDSIHVQDRRGLIIFSPDMASHRSRPDSSPAMAMVLLPDGRMIRTAPLNHTFARAGSLLSVVGADGGGAAPFGLPEPESLNCLSCYVRGVSLSADGREILSTHHNRYRIERYALSGELRDSIVVRNSSWMVPWVDEAPHGTMPAPSLHVATGVGADLIAVVGHRPSAQWAPLTLPPPDSTDVVVATVGGRTFTAVRANSMPAREILARGQRKVSTVVDVIDPARRQLLVSTVVEEERYLHIERDLFCVMRVSGDGVITFDVYRLSVTRPGVPTM